MKKKLKDTFDIYEEYDDYIWALAKFVDYLNSPKVREQFAEQALDMFTILPIRRVVLEFGERIKNHEKDLVLNFQNAVEQTDSDRRAGDIHETYFKSLGEIVKLMSIIFDVKVE